MRQVLINRLRLVVFVSFCFSAVSLLLFGCLTGCKHATPTSDVGLLQPSVLVAAAQSRTSINLVREVCRTDSEAISQSFWSSLLGIDSDLQEHYISLLVMEVDLPRYSSLIDDILINLIQKFVNGLMYRPNIWFQNTSGGNSVTVTDRTISYRQVVDMAIAYSEHLNPRVDKLMGKVFSNSLLQINQGDHRYLAVCFKTLQYLNSRDIELSEDEINTLELALHGEKRSWRYGLILGEARSSKHSKALGAGLDNRLR